MWSFAWFRCFVVLCFVCLFVCGFFQLAKIWYGKYQCFSFAFICCFICLLVSLFSLFIICGLYLAKIRFGKYRRSCQMWSVALLGIGDTPHSVHCHLPGEGCRWPMQCISWCQKCEQTHYWARVIEPSQQLTMPLKVIKEEQVNMFFPMEVSIFESIFINGDMNQINKKNLDSIPICFDIFQTKRCANILYYCCKYLWCVRRFFSCRLWRMNYKCNWK